MLLLGLMVACRGEAGTVPPSDPPGGPPAAAAPDPIAIAFSPALRGVTEPTDVQFPPGRADVGVVLGKGGTAWWWKPGTEAVDVGGAGVGEWFEVEVYTNSECGLLGLAFHPKFAENGKFYLNYCQTEGGRVLSRITEWSVTPGSDLAASKPKLGHLLLEVVQPYDNHDGGQLQFGPDGMLYIGFGDGGSHGDPHGNGQDPGALLGKMLRIDVDHAGPGTPYAVPPDNPFVGTAGFRPEIWAYGLRNPWRYSFAPDGRLVVADVGQDTWEEVDIVAAGDNLGWNWREARHCFKPGCSTQGFVEPIAEYTHREGISITGGYVATGNAVPALAGKYVYADFGSGRFWALDLPDDRTGPLVKPIALARLQLSASTFGRDGNGDLYVADYATGVIFRLVAGSGTP